MQTYKSVRADLLRNPVENQETKTGLTQQYLQLWERGGG
jgi:hypothetical protein